MAAQNLYEDTANEVHIEISRTLEGQVDRGIRRAGSSQSMIYQLNQANQLSGSVQPSNGGLPTSWKSHSSQARPSIGQSSSSQEEHK